MPETPPSVDQIKALQAKARKAREKLEEEGSASTALWEAAGVGAELAAHAALKLIEEAGPLVIEFGVNALKSWLEAKVNDE